MLIGTELSVLTLNKTSESTTEEGRHIIIQHDWVATGSEFGSLTSESESYLQTVVVDYKSVLLKCHKIYVCCNLQTYSCSALDESKGKTCAEVRKEQVLLQKYLWDHLKCLINLERTF